VTEILGPVLAPYGVKTSLKGLINGVLYGKQESNKNTEHSLFLKNWACFCPSLLAYK
jgi:hypothetical protein